MSNNTFTIHRFKLLIRQQAIHYSRILLLASIAYVGLVFIVLSITQIGNGLKYHNTDIFLGWFAGSIIFFGMLLAGHSFPSFRNKESTINYLMLPASALEKFILEFVVRIGIIFIMMPILYWMTFHFQGYFFSIFLQTAYDPVHLLSNTLQADFLGHKDIFWRLSAILSMTFLAFVVAFTGSTIFSKQPLIKTLFSVAIIFMFYLGYAYVVVEHLGVGAYQPPENSWLFPIKNGGPTRFFCLVSLAISLIFLFVSYSKLKEKEV
ncbi:MAG: hypothetical protein ACFHWX_09625 [Bacteroidota bacterium]